MGGDRGGNGGHRADDGLNENVREKTRTFIFGFSGQL
jgi:hypothetical protein